MCECYIVTSSVLGREFETSPHACFQGLPGLYTLWDCIHYGLCTLPRAVYIARTVYIMGLYTSWAVHMGGHVSGRPLPEIAVFTE